MSWELTKCCLCLPLRNGLMIYGYFGLVMNYFCVLHKLFQINDYLDGSVSGDNFQFIDLSLIFAFLIVHFIFHIILVAGVHRKSRCLLEAFYGYQMILVIGEVVVSSLYLPLQIYKNYQILRHDVWLPAVVGFALTVLILLQLYLIVTVRSNITSLEDSQEGTYLPEVNDLENPECTLQFYNKNKDYCDHCE